MILNPFPPFLNSPQKGIRRGAKKVYHLLMKFSCFYQLFHQMWWGNIMLHIHSGCLSQGLNNRRLTQPCRKQQLATECHHLEFLCIYKSWARREISGGILTFVVFEDKQKYMGNLFPRIIQQHHAYLLPPEFGLESQLPTLPASSQCRCWRQTHTKG